MKDLKVKVLKNLGNVFVIVDVNGNINVRILNFFIMGVFE